MNADLSARPVSRIKAAAAQHLAYAWPRENHTSKARGRTHMVLRSCRGVTLTARGDLPCCPCFQPAPLVSGRRQRQPSPRHVLE